MAYQAIYRKWRPLVFDDIVGQTHITTTLKNQIQTNRIAHAYLFCGTRGTGKTTAAKIFSRAVNCENPKDGSPCNECASCRGILDGSILDVSEIDAASNNGVDNIREIREDVNYVATHTKYRIYIIDEVHSLSRNAFDALLKTLEEPPEHIIFILATTEAHKVPETILSRCQRFDFKRIRPADIIVRMKEIAVGDGLNISEDAYPLLAKFADGSMRDGLSILERCISECGNTLTAADIVNTMGLAPSDLLFSTADAICSDNTEAILTVIARLVDEGKDLNVFVDALTTHFRDLLVCKVAKTPEELLDYTAEDMSKLKSQAEKVSYSAISRAIDLLTEAKADAKWIKNPRIVYEIALVRLTRPELDNSSDSLIERIEKLEEQVKNGVTVTKVVEQKTEEKKEPEKKEVSARQYVPLDVNALSADSPIVVAARNWDKISQAIAKKMPHVASVVINRKITIDGEGIILVFKKSEIMLKKIASTYLNAIRNEFSKNVSGDFAFKTAFEDDIADYMVDFWQIQGKSTPGKVVIEENTVQKVGAKDPLDTLTANFPEIIESTDESEFLSYERERFEQTEFEEDERDIDEEKMLEEYENEE